MPFMAGGEELGYPALLVAPDNAGFFAGGLADLQGFIPGSKIPEGFKPRAIYYLAPTFRHTHFHGKQMVVHNRLDEVYELFHITCIRGRARKGCLWRIDQNWRGRGMDHGSWFNRQDYYTL